MPACGSVVSDGEHLHEKGKCVNLHMIASKNVLSFKLFLSQLGVEPLNFRSSKLSKQLVSLTILRNGFIKEPKNIKKHVKDQVTCHELKIIGYTVNDHSVSCYI